MNIYRNLTMPWSFCKLIFFNFHPTHYKLPNLTLDRFAELLN